jgi:hypothetical protein
VQPWRIVAAERVAETSENRRLRRACELTAMKDFAGDAMKASRLVVGSIRSARDSCPIFARTHKTREARGIRDTE